MKKLATFAYLALGCLAQLQLALSQVVGPSSPLLTSERIAAVQQLSLTIEGSSDGLKFPLALGSGISPLGSRTGKARYLFAITDRGPNIRGSKRSDGAEIVSLPAAHFSPSVALLKIRMGRLEPASAAEVREIAPGLSKAILPLRDRSGKPLSGIPPAHSAQVAESQGAELANDVNGVDSEALAVDEPRQMIWMAEEYRPSVWGFNLNSLREVQRLVPGSGLPSLLSTRQINRGFEGLALTPNGDLVAALQSPLTLPNGEIEPFLRLVKIVLSKDMMQASTMSYALHLPNRSEIKDYKIGDLFALDNTTFLALENLKYKNGVELSQLIALSFNGATPLPSQETPYPILPTQVRGLQRIPLLDFASLRWEIGKIEGVLAFDGGRTLVFAKDNDFGVSETKKSSQINQQHPELNREETQTKEQVRQPEFLNQPTQFLIVTLQQPLGDLLLPAWSKATQ